MNKQKKTFAVLFAMIAVLLTSAAVYADDYWGRIAGRNITSENCNDIWGDGAFKYDHNIKTLYVKKSFNDADKNEYGDSSAAQYLIDLTGVGNSTIIFENDCVITSSKGGIDGGCVTAGKVGGCTIQGPGKLTLNTRYNGINAYNSLIFKDIEFEVTSKSNYALTRCFGGLNITFDNSCGSFVCNDDNGAVYSSVNCKPTIFRNGSFIYYPYTYAESKGNIYESDGITPAKKVCISRPDRYIVRYSENGGTGEMEPVMAKYGDKITLPECIFTPPIYFSFDHWEINGDGKAYNPGDTYTVNDDTDIKAIYKVTAPSFKKDLPESINLDIGNGWTFYVDAINADSYEWMFVDSNDRYYTAKGAVNEGFFEFNGSSTGTAPSLMIRNIAAKANGGRLYCILKGGGYSVNSTKCLFIINKTITYASFDIKNIDKAVHDAKVGDFKTAVAPDGAPYTGEVRWSQFTKILSDDTQLYYKDTYVIGIIVTPKDGYTISNSFSGSINGTTAECLHIVPSSSEDYYVMQISYTVPAPENGILIEKATKKIGEPTVGEACANAEHMTIGVKPNYQSCEILSTSWTDLTDSLSISTGTAFEPNKVYSVRIVLQAFEDYHFDDSTVFTLNDHIPEVTLYNYGKIAVMYYPFVKEGDVDLNNTVNKNDSALLLKYIGESVKALSPEQFSVAKVTDSTKQKPDMLDVIAILKIAGEQ